MNKNIIISLLSIVILTACKKPDIAEGTPECIQQKIKIFNKGLTACEGANAKQYQFQGKTVFVIWDGDCVSDGGGNVYDSECNNLGFLGGIGGLSQINGVDFFKNATLEKTIWIWKPKAYHESHT